MTNSGSRKINTVLDIPALYRIYNWLIGGSRAQQELVDKYLRPTLGCSILDIGCGPGDILRCFSSVNYVGLDINRAYIDTARRCFGDIGTFFHKTEGNLSILEKESFDIVMAIGVLHHLDDSEATELLQLAHLCMRPDGRVVTVDGCYTNNGSRLEHYILSKDRGSFVRTEEAYRNLAQKVFSSVKVTIRRDLLRRIPYTHIIQEFTR